MIDLASNYPVVPAHGARVSALLAQATAYGDSWMRFHPIEGTAGERAVAARYLRRAGREVPSDALLLCSGGHHALSVIALACLPAGATVATEPITYNHWLGLARLHGLDLVGAPCDADGLVPDGLDELCRERRVHAIYTMPTLHNPLGRVMSAERRQAVVDVCRRHDLQIIEDDACAFLVEDPPPGFVHIAPERTYHVASLSKPVAPAVKLAFLVVPERAVPAARDGIRWTSHGPSGPVAAVGLELARSGELEGMCAAKRDEARRRQAWAREVWRGPTYQTWETSMHLWLPLPPGLDPVQVHAALLERGVATLPGSAFGLARSRPPRALRVALGSEDDRDRLQLGLAMIADFVAGYGATGSGRWHTNSTWWPSGSRTKPA